MKKVVTIGSAVADIIVRSKDFRVLKSHQVSGGLALCEVYGGKLRAEEIKILTGGGGTNVGVGLKKLGHSVRVMSVVGGDDWGKLVLRKLEEEALDVSYIKEIKGGTAVSVILVAKSGGRSIITHRGVGQKFGSREIDWRVVEKADWIQISSLGGNLALLEDSVMFAKKKGVKVGMNPGKRELENSERLKKILKGVDFLSLNHMEAVKFFKGKWGEDKAMAIKFLGLGVGMVAITDGIRGAGIAKGNTWFRAKAFKMKSVDDTGAGDGFVSGVVAGILAEETQERILLMGVANGASAVMGLGAKLGLLDEKEMKKWLKKKTSLVEEKLTD